MKRIYPLRWGRRALAALLCFGILMSTPLGSALAERPPDSAAADPQIEVTLPDVPSEGGFALSESMPADSTGSQPESGQSASSSEQPAQSEPAADASSSEDEAGSPSGADSQAASVPESIPQSQVPAAEEPAGDAAVSEPAPLPEEETEEHETDASRPSGTVSAYAGLTVTFVDLQWKTAPLAGVDALFTGGEGLAPARVPMEAGGRGQYTAVVPQGDYYRVAFYPSGQTDAAAPLGGVWRLDGQEDDPQAAGGTVAFATGSLSAFYYDSGDNPSYWGAAPDYDANAAVPALMAANSVQTLAAGDPAEPQGGEQLYFVNLHRLKGDETDPIVTVEARFIQWPHEGANDSDWQNGSQYIARTMYEVRDGVYVVPFPDEIDTASADNYMGYLYQEVAFDITRESGEKDAFNRHYNFRGHQSETTVGDTWGVPGWFTYAQGSMDAYYYNTNVEDSYWNAHPSNADEGLHSRMLYIDTRDFSETEGNTPYQNLSGIYLSWDGMPTNLPGYDAAQGGIRLDGEGSTYNTQTAGIYYFQIPADAEDLTENTVFTLTYQITDETSSLHGWHTFLFTYVPRSGKDTIRMDYLWEDVGEVWGTYQAQPDENSTRAVYFNNTVTAFKHVQVVLGTRDENDNYTWMTGNEALRDPWATEHVINGGIGDWARGWLKMERKDTTENRIPLPGNVWGLEGIPEKYTHVMFRCSVEADADTNYGDNDLYWFSPPLEIDKTYSNPCFFAYRYLHTNTHQLDDAAALGDMKYLDGRWGSALEIYTLGDASADVPQGEGFTSQDNVYYATTSFYDYYSLWEMSGRNIKDVRLNDNGNDYRPQYNYNKQGVLWNIAISLYFQELDRTGNTQTYPLYFGAGDMLNDTPNSPDAWDWGHILKHNYPQLGALYLPDPDGGPLYNNSASGKTDPAWHANVWEANGGSRTGLVDSRLQDGSLTMNGYQTPYFSETFLRGDNPVGATLGTVYNNVLFPFRLNKEGYWEYSSEDTGVALKQDPDGTYYMEKTGPFYLNYGVGATASYMPFHEAKAGEQGSGAGNALKNLRANYMFGQKLELQFTVPEGGVVQTEDGQTQDVIFEFRGDDDCWVFIDGQLVLDMGGIHDPVRGTINFKEGTWQTWRDLDAAGGKIDKTGTFHLTGDADTVHTLTMFYLERGLNGSNLSVIFNFPQQNRLRVTKEVDTSDVNALFDEAMDNLGSFQVDIQTMATSGRPLPVENSAGYVETQSRPLYNAADEQDTVEITEPDGGTAVEKPEETSDDSHYLEITQPNGWKEGAEPGTGNLLKISVSGQNGIDLSGYAFLEMELYNATTENRGAELYIQLQDASGKTCGGTARTLGYLGEANLFLPNTRSLVRIDLDDLIANSGVDRTKITAVYIGLQKGTGTGEGEAGHYRLYRAAFGTEWNQVLSTGFSVGDDQISDYGSLAQNNGTSKGYQPANGAWYTRQTRDAGGNIAESVASVVQGGSFSLADGQTAVFTDKFRVGSYIRLEETVDSELFTTSWSIREDGQPVSFNSLLPDRPDAGTVQNPDWEFDRGQYPLEDQPGTEPDDGRKEKNPSVGGISGDTAGDITGFVYRSYRYPDNNENLPVNLEVVFHNKMRTGSFTLTKQLDESMCVAPDGDGEGEMIYPVGVYTFDVYYTNIAGRGLEQFLPVQETVEGVGNRYVHQVITITTESETGQGVFRMDGIPAGTNYVIRERPSNGATLVKLEGADGTVRGVIGDGENADYTHAYISDAVNADAADAGETPNYTFTNENEPFFMRIEKQWQGDPPGSVKEIRIQVQRREAGAEDQEWENVTQNFFGTAVGEDDTITLKPDENGNWTALSIEIFPTQGTTEENKTVLYEYRIVELDVGKGPLASYRVEYTELPGAEQDGPPVVIYRATNIPTALAVQKTWLDNEDRDDTRPTAVRVRLQRSSKYNPDAPSAEGVEWEFIGSDGEVTNDANNGIELTASNGWSYVLNGLPASDEKGHLYYYRVVEVEMQKEGGWVSLEEQGVYEPAYSPPATLGETAVLTVENALKTAQIQVTKVDADTMATLPGAKFKLERLQENGDGSWAVDANWNALEDLTNENGVLTFVGLRPGRYRLTETKAPKGYVAAFTPQDIILGADSLQKTYTVTVENGKGLSFAFTKVAAEDNDTPLSGAEFCLYPLVCGDSHTHSDAPGICWGTGGQVQTQTSGEDGRVCFDNLPAGVYRLVETKAPAGYALPTGQWQVTLDKTGSVQIAAVGSVPAFQTGSALRLTNRRPMDIPSSGGPGVPLAAALGTAMMGAGAILIGTQLRRGRGKKQK